MPSRQRPMDCIEAVTLHNVQNSTQRYIPMQFSVNSWVILEPDLNSEWGRDSERYAVSSPQYYWKAKIVGFKHAGVDNELETKILVHHAYEPRQLSLDPQVPRPRIPCNYLLTSYFEDWVEPASVLGLIIAMYSDIGKRIHHDRTHRELHDQSIFFFKYVYIPPAGHHLYGQLEEIPFPGFGSLSWPLPDMSTSESFRAKLRSDFRAAMKPTTGSRRSSVKWFIPFTVFVDLFALAKNRIRTPTLFTFRNLDDATFSNLMDDGWSSKTTVGDDIIKCRVSLPSVVFTYHIGRQNLYANFYFTRERAIGREWVPLEHERGVPLVSLSCELIEANPPLVLQFTVGYDWPITHLRHEVQISMGHASPKEYAFIVSKPGGVDRKMNRRKEHKTVVADVLPPYSLKLKIFDD